MVPFKFIFYRLPLLIYLLLHILPDHFLKLIFFNKNEILLLHNLLFWCWATNALWTSFHVIKYSSTTSFCYHCLDSSWFLEPMADAILRHCGVWGRTLKWCDCFKRNPSDNYLKFIIILFNRKWMALSKCLEVNKVIICQICHAAMS